MASRLTRLVAVGGTVIAALAGPVAGASAQEQVVAGPQPSTYLNPEVAIDPGDALNFQNVDVTAAHDVTSADVGPGAEALFRSETVDAFTTVPVVGAESLAPGTYAFFCSVHTFMEGTLTVRGEGGGEGGGPSLALRARDGRISKVLRAGELRLRAKVDEPAELRLKAEVAGGNGTVAKTTERLESGDNRVAAELTRRGKRALDGADRVKLKLSGRATDDAGNSARDQAKVTLR